MITDNVYIIKRYYYLIKDNRKKLNPFYLFVFLNCIADLLIPIVISNIVNLITKGLYNEGLTQVLVLAVLYGVNTILSYLDCKIYSNFLKHNYVTIHNKIVQEIYNFDEDYQKHLPRGKILNSISMDLINISEMADSCYNVFIQSLKLVIIFLCLIRINLIIGILVLIFAFIYIKLSYYLNEKSAHYFSLQLKNSDKLLGLLQQTLIGIKDIKNLNLSRNLDKKFNLIRKRWQNSYITRRKYLILQKTTLKYVIYIGKILLYFISIYSIYLGKFEIGTLLLVVSYYDKFFDSSIEIMSNETVIKEENISMERIYKILEYNHKKDTYLNKNMSQNKKELIGIIEFQKVYFSYKKENTLKDISFKMMPNQLNVIVGKTGSGKTTLFSLLTRLYNLKKGSIKIDGYDINDLNDKEYSKYISILNQDSFLFNLSIRENFNLVCSDSKKQIEICKKVGIHDFIMSLPKGYHSVLSENSTNVSGGQKRLLSLARMLLSDKKILLFDEITSSLDTNTTNTIIGLLQEMKQNHTIIVITHKKEMMKQADYIVIINKGRKVGAGTHKELLRKNKYYQKLYKNNK